MGWSTTFKVTSTFWCGERQNDWNRAWLESMKDSSAPLKPLLVALNFVMAFGLIKDAGFGREGSKHGVDYVHKYVCFGGLQNLGT